MIRKTVPQGNSKQELPLVPMRELVIYPHMVIPFFAGRGASIKAIEEAMLGNRMVFLSCQKNPVEDPGIEDLYPAGCTAKIVQMLKLPDGTIRVLAEGKERGALLRLHKKKEIATASFRVFPYDTEVTSETAALMSAILDSFRRYAALNKKVTQETVQGVEKAEFPDKLADLVCAAVSFRTEKKAELLGIEQPLTRLETLAVYLEAENEILNLQSKINAKVKKRLEKNQREYYLSEQLKEINKELGREETDATGVKEFREKMVQKNLPPEVLEKTEKEIGRLGKLQPMSPESGILRTYIEWILDLPWNERTQDNKDILKAASILDEDHYDMKKPKERILDFIAVRQLRESLKGPILCLVGPPGTGKTSLGRSVARALDRSFVRVSLGGIRDEAEIRGHRKTYVGALPGKIIQSMKKAGTMNPVFLLDEIDKISSDYRGDPASALLEVLDPEQNRGFVDHYLEVPYDLSGVMFITTANSIHTIPYPLRDRMEIIEIPGYTEYEKLKIATGFIIPKQIEENGLSWADIRFRENAILEIIRGYTMESGVRNLEREIAGIIRKIARDAVKKGFAKEPALREEAAAWKDDGTGGQETARAAAAGTGAAVADNGAAESAASSHAPQSAAYRKLVTSRSVSTYLGKRRFQGDLIYKEVRPGLAYGLAWTEMGGTLLPIEVAILEGEGELILTGSLGDVMKESARTSLSFIRAHSRKFSLSTRFQKNVDIHIHVPEGAIPKDGPSAGITITAALVSALSGIPVNQGLAMTGEITLTGRLLPIGGVKEKVLAAHRNSLLRVLLPEGNRKDIDELPPEVTGTMTFLFADSVPDAIKYLFPPDLFA